MLSLRRSLVSIAAFSALTPASKDLIVFALGKKGYSQWELPAYDRSRGSQSTLRHKETELIPCALVDEEHGQMVWCIFFFNDVWRHNPPLAILQVLPLIRAILANPEAGFEYIAVVAARFPWNAEPQLCGWAHYLLVIPFVVRHRRIVSVSTKATVRDRTLSWQPPLWTVIYFSIRESHELSSH